jgi:DNA-binding CsgD family transcriptional regulator
MSRGTVKTHLSHVYAKLGVANRTQLATLTFAHVATGDNAAAAARSSKKT